jgi:hypothetical protein
MPPRYAAAIGCPACGTRFQTPVEQILDIRVDPSAKNRMLSGTVNFAVCPSCGTAAMLNLPFIYHDPDNEIALLYLPVDAGPNEVERQKAVGRLARELMNSMPPEERKGYLLQPETFISIETMVKRVLELEGVTEEDMTRSQNQRELLNTFITSENESWDKLVEENYKLVDESFFALIEYVVQISVRTGNEESDADKFSELQDYLIENTEIGKQLAERAEVVQRFAENPTRENLLHALLVADDEETRTSLIQARMDLLDYTFFQQLLDRIEQATTDDEKETLVELRRQILAYRDDITQASQALVQERAMLLGKLLETENPRLMASSHLSELDNTFFFVLSTQMQDAEKQKNEKRLEELQEIAGVINSVMESTLPPEVAFTRRLMMIPDDAQLRQTLEANKQALTPQYLAFLQAVVESGNEQGEVESADRLTKVLAIAKSIVPEVAIPDEQAVAQTGPSLQESPGSEERTPSGLIIAKH